MARSVSRRVVRVLASVLLFGAAAAGFARFWTPVSRGGPAQTPRPPSITGESPPASPSAADSRTSEQAAAELVGAASCRECHPGESAAHSRSGHSRTLRRGDLSAIARWLDGRTVKDPEATDATWTYSLVKGKLEVERAEKGKFHCYPLDLAIGSGTNGVTFVTLRPPAQAGSGATGIEHRLSYLAGSKKMEVTPGQGTDDTSSRRTEVTPHGRDLDESALAKCVRCHATSISTHGPTRVDAQSLVTDVSCERCHGPGRSHIALARQGGSDEQLLRMPLGLDDSTPLRQIGICGECHRTTRSVSPAQIDERNPEIARFQPLGLELSRCFQGGKSGLSCTSCHDPHARTGRDHKHYEAVCLKCHSPAHRRTCPVSATEGCVKCHMPRRTVSVDFQFTDHWIRRNKPEDPPATAP